MGKFREVLELDDSGVPSPLRWRLLEHLRRPATAPRAAFLGAVHNNN